MCQWEGERRNMVKDVKDSIVLPPGTAVAIPLGEGDVAKVVTPEGGQGGDLTFLGFDQALTRNINGGEKFREKFGNLKLTFYADAGMKLYDADGTAYLEIMEVHSDLRVDIMYPGCWREIYEDGRPGCRDLLSEALGVERRELTGMASFFVKCSVDDDGYVFSQVDSEPGDYLTLKALRPVTLGISTCPDTELQANPSDLVVEVRNR